MTAICFKKYHGLGNDYLVIDPTVGPLDLTPERIRFICDRHFGVGSDGLLYGPLVDASGRHRVQIFNPDGSEAEKSGNGLRIFARYLYDAASANSASSSLWFMLWPDDTPRMRPTIGAPAR